jgi:hypothetical protein
MGEVPLTAVKSANHVCPALLKNLAPNLPNMGKDKKYTLSTVFVLKHHWIFINAV